MNGKFLDGRAIVNSEGYTCMRVREILINQPKDTSLSFQGLENLKASILM